MDPARFFGLFVTDQFKWVKSKLQDGLGLYVEIKLISTDMRSEKVDSLAFLGQTDRCARGVCRPEPN